MTVFQPGNAEKSPSHQAESTTSSQKPGCHASLAYRYMGKLAANIATIPLYLLMEAILPRALGPQTYGNFNFVTSVFNQFTNFLDMGTSTCFYNALSRRQNEFSLVAFYVRVSFFVLLVTLCAGFLLLVPDAGAFVLPDVPLWYAPLAALFAFLLWGTRLVRSMNDALGLTVPGEFLRSMCNLLGAALLLVLFGLEWLNAGSLFALQYGIMGATIIGCLAIMRHSWPRPDFSLTTEQCRAYVREFAEYSSPLFVQALLSAFALCVERWILQWFDGSVQQGYFALSQRVSMACFMFVSAMTPLIMRELAIAWGKNNRELMGKLVDRCGPPLFAIAAWFSCFTAVEAATLIRIFGGNEFIDALIPVQIMALYPAHQAYGQLASSVFHAAGKTAILRNLAFFEHTGGLVMVWVLVAPPASLGLGLGAAGLACKTVLVQVIMVNLLLYLASRLIPLRFFTHLFFQGSILVTFFALAWGSSRAAVLLFGESGEIVPRFLAAGLFYVALSLLSVLLCPRLVGCSSEDLRSLAKRAGRIFRKNGVREKNG